MRGGWTALHRRVAKDAQRPTTGRRFLPQGCIDWRGHTSQPVANQKVSPVVTRLPLDGQGEVAPSLLLKDPYVLDFLELTDRFLERDLEDAILRELETFLLELGSGFSFIARQKRIQVDGDDFYMDLLFYNRRLRRLVVVELKQGRFKPEYKGQMELYLRWLAQHEIEAGESAPLGIILCAGKNTEQIELLELGSAGIHVAEYLTILPPPEVMHAKLHEAIETARARMELKQTKAIDDSNMAE